MSDKLKTIDDTKDYYYVDGDFYTPEELSRQIEREIYLDIYKKKQEEVNTGLWVIIITFFVGLLVGAVIF